MPFMKINLNGRKYVLSGISDRTSSKHILCSLARVDSSFHLETTCTELSDETSVENVECTKRTRTTRTRRTRVQHSSTSSLEMIAVKSPLKGALSPKNILVGLENSEKESGIWNSEKCSRKLLFSDIAKESTKRHLESKKATCESHVKHDNNGNEYHVVTGEGLTTCPKKTEVKKKKRKVKKRPVSQDVTGWKEKKDKERETKLDTSKKRWKSADDIREKDSSLTDERRKKRKEKHKKKPKSKHDKSEKNSCQDSQTVVLVDSIDNASECRRVHRHVRKELGDLRIQRMISRAIDQRFVDFHVSCVKSYGCAHHHHENDRPNNEQEIRAKLMKLVETQKKCLSALDKAKKQNKKAISRYSKYLELGQDKLQFYNFPNNDKSLEKPKRTRSTSETDTGISELHSDSGSSNDSRNPHVYNNYHRDANIDYVISDDKANTYIMENKSTRIDVKDDVTKENVSRDDVASNDSNYIVTVDAVAIDDDTHDVKRYTYEKDDDAQSEIIVAEPTEVIPFDQPDMTKSLAPYHSAETMSTLSDLSDRSSHGNGDDVHDAEELSKVLLQEKQKQQETKRKIDRRCEEMRLMDLRIQEHEKMAEILERLKLLNEGALQNEENNLAHEKQNLEKSKKLSKNLYEYQKSEISKNATSLQQIETQIRRKRWHVESAVKELGRVVSSLSQTQLDRIRSLQDLKCISGLSTTSNSEFKPLLNGTMV